MSLLSSGSTSASEGVREWLLDKKVEPMVADEIISLLRHSTTLSISSLSQLGTTGLQQLVQSVERDLQRKEVQRKDGQQHERVSVRVSNPRAYRDIKTIEVLPNETLYDTVITPILSDLEFACGGNAACSTCHVIVDDEWYSKLAAPEEEELDMLELAHSLTHTSRLACQMKIPSECDGMLITIPHQANNLF